MSKNNVLDALLKTEIEVKNDVPMKRFGVDFTLQALDGKTINKIQEQATFYQGKGKNREKIMNEEKFQSLIIEKGCLNPNWNDPALKEAFKDCATTSDVIQKRLLAGELAYLANEILELSGFYDDEEDIKN